MIESYLDARAPINVQQVTLSTTATSATLIHPAGGVGRQPLVFLSTVDCYIRFGGSTVGAATNAYELFKANVPVKLDLSNSSQYFSALGTGAGTLYWYIEGEAGDTVRSILGALWVDQWDREYGASAAAWVSRKGRSAAAVNTPTYAADGTNFKGQPVPGTTKSGPNNFAGTVTSLGAVGTRPYFAAVGRFLGSLATDDTLCALTNDAAPDLEFAVRVAGSNVAGFFEGVSVTGPAVDSNVHLFEIWNDGSLTHFAVDGVDTTSASGATVANALVNVHIGASFSGNNPVGSFVSRLIVASAAPTTAQRVLLLNLLRSLDGF